MIALRPPAGCRVATSLRWRSSESHPLLPWRHTPEDLYKFEDCRVKAPPRAATLGTVGARVAINPVQDGPVLEEDAEEVNGSRATNSAMLPCRRVGSLRQVQRCAKRRDGDPTQSSAPVCRR
jgi:hypothetical protein